MKGRRSRGRLRRTVMGLAALLLLLLAIISFAAGEFFSRPARHAIGAAPPDLRAVSVQLPTSRVLNSAES